MQTDPLVQVIQFAEQGEHVAVDLKNPSLHAHFPKSWAEVITGSPLVHAVQVNTEVVSS